MVLCKKLNALGVQASAVCDGVEALLAVADRSWDMVLMDGEMPVMDGIKAAREIRAQHLLDECAPIVGISSNQDAGFRQQCRSAGISACLPKPRNTKDLEILLNEFLVPGPPGRGWSTEPMPTNFEAVG
jgi:CheY-like chemotaxis protein